MRDVAALNGIERSTIYDGITDAVCYVLAIKNPQAAMQYRASREQQYLYAAGSRKKKLHTMRPNNKSADELIKSDMSNARAECRQMVRNNPNLSGAMREMGNNVVFKGILPQAQFSEEREAENTAIEHEWMRWGRQVKLRRKLKQTVTHIWQDGGIFWHFTPSKTLHERGVVPLNLELLEVDHLDHMLNADLDNGNFIKHGIEYNSEGFVAAYWLFEKHPGSTHGLVRGSIYKSKRVDAKYCILVADPDRASQSLPIPRLASVVCILRDFEQYQNFERLAARLAAAFSVIVKDTSTQPMGGNNLSGNASADTGNPQSRIPATEAFINPGSITELPAGKDIQTISNPRPSNTYSDYSRNNMQATSTGVGQSYETFTNDFTAASYSSVRQAISKERRGYMEQQQSLIEDALDPAFEIWCFFAHLFGFIGTETVPVSWQTPGWEYINPLQDANATKVQIEMGIENPFDAAAARGRNLDDNIKKTARAKRLRISAGLEGKEQSDGTETA